MGISLSYEDKIAVLDLGDDENRFSPSSRPGRHAPRRVGQLGCAGTGDHRWRQVLFQRS